MQLERINANHFILSGVVNFDNAADIEMEGRLLLEKDFIKGGVLRIDLSNLLVGDSSTLAVCLSWLRAAQKRAARLCMVSVPEELAALAKVCGVDQILAESTCRES